jgi:hypothetical protein
VCDLPSWFFLCRWGKRVGHCRVCKRIHNKRGRTVKLLSDGTKTNFFGGVERCWSSGWWRSGVVRSGVVPCSSRRYWSLWWLRLVVVYCRRDYHGLRHFCARRKRWGGVQGCSRNILSTWIWKCVALPNGAHMQRRQIDRVMSPEIDLFFSEE